MREITQIQILSIGKYFKRDNVNWQIKYPVRKLKHKTHEPMVAETEKGEGARVVDIRKILLWDDITLIP